MYVHLWSSDSSFFLERGQHSAECKEDSHCIDGKRLFHTISHFVTYDNIFLFKITICIMQSLNELKHSFTGNDRPPKIHGDKRRPL